MAVLDSILSSGKVNSKPKNKNGLDTGDKASADVFSKVLESANKGYQANFKTKPAKNLKTQENNLPDSNLGLDKTAKKQKNQSAVSQNLISKEKTAQNQKKTLDTPDEQALETVQENQPKQVKNNPEIEKEILNARIQLATILNHQNKSVNSGKERQGEKVSAEKKTEIKLSAENTNNSPEKTLVNPKDTLQQRLMATSSDSQLDKQLKIGPETKVSTDKTVQANQQGVSASSNSQLDKQLKIQPETKISTEKTAQANQEGVSASSNSQLDKQLKIQPDVKISTDKTVHLEKENVKISIEKTAQTNQEGVSQSSNSQLEKQLKIQPEVKISTDKTVHLEKENVKISIDKTVQTNQEGVSASSNSQIPDKMAKEELPSAFMKAKDFIQKELISGNIHIKNQNTNQSNLNISGAKKEQIVEKSQIKEKIENTLAQAENAAQIAQNKVFATVDQLKKVDTKQQDPKKLQINNEEIKNTGNTQESRLQGKETEQKQNGEKPLKDTKDGFLNILGGQHHLNNVKSNNIVDFEKIKEHKPNPFNESVLNQVNKKLASEISQSGKTEITIALNPDNLGKVEVNLVSNNGVLTASILTENSKVKEVLNKEVESLRQTLADQGINVGKIIVQESNTSSNNQNNNKQQADQSFQNFENLENNENNPLNQNLYKQANKYNHADIYTGLNNVDLEEDSQQNTRQTSNISGNAGKIDYRV